AELLTPDVAARNRSLTRAAAAFARRDLAAAEALCREALATTPGDADALHLLGLARRHAGDLAAAEPLLRTSIERAPTRAEFRVNLANLLAATGRLAAAEAELRAAAEIEPGSRSTRLALARVLLRRGAAADAEHVARSLVLADRMDAEAWSALAAAERDQGRLDSAESSYRRALSIRPDYAL